MIAAALAALLALGAAAPVRGQEEGAGAELPGIIPMGGMIVFANVSAPLSLVTMPAKPKGAVDVGEVHASRCQHGVSIPLTASLRASSLSGAAGDGGYEKAVAELKTRRPELAGLYDVRVDEHLFSILGIYRRLCVEITARGYR